MRIILRLTLFVCTVIGFHSSLSSSTQASLILATDGTRLVTFDSASPNLTSAAINITGLNVGDTLRGIDLRPANSQVYGFATNGTVGRVYVINRLTGVATLSSTLSVAVSGANFGVDFNPVADRMRVVSDLRQNLRIDVSNGATTVDTALAYAANDVNAAATPNITAAAYTNSFAGAATTTLFDIDNTLNILTTQIPPNSGTLNTIGALNRDVGASVAFDIDGLNGQGFVADGLSFSQINLANGNLTLIGNVGTLTSILDITAVPEPTSLLLVGLSAAAVTFRRWRRKS